MQYKCPYIHEKGGCSCCPYGMWQSYYNYPMDYSPINYNEVPQQGPTMGMNPMMPSNSFPYTNYREENFNEVFDDGENVEAEAKIEEKEMEDVQVNAEVVDEPISEDAPIMEDETRAFNESRNKNDVNRVVGSIERKLRPVYDEIVRVGVGRKLLDYMVYTIVTYIDKNYNKYKGNIDMKVKKAEADIRVRYPFIYDLLRIYSVSPATQMRLIDGVIRTSFEELRRIPPKPAPPPPPGPMPR